MERHFGLQKATDKHPFKGMQDPRIEADPNLAFDRSVRGILNAAGADTKVIENVMPGIVDAANDRQRAIGERSTITPSEEDIAGGMTGIYDKPLKPFSE